jgi:hypothetical protein
MESPAHSPAPARNHRGRPPWVTMPLAVPTFTALAVALLLMGCGASGGGSPSPPSLVTGRRAAPLPSAQLASATRAAESFARAYVPTVYLRRPPWIPGTTASVRRDLTLAATRVPPGRRGLRPRLAGLRLKLLPGGRVGAAVRIVDGRSRPFSLGFSLSRSRGGWRIVSVSTPG